MKRILLLGSQHGNELLGEQLYGYIQRHCVTLLPHITYKVANPQAHRQNKRYIETDMNRSYVASPVSYEERRAAKIMQYLQAKDFDLVLDLHSTACDQPPSILIRSVNLRNRDFLRASHIEHVVMMQHEIVKSSLIGNVEYAISMEVSNQQITDELLNKLTQDILRYVNGGLQPVQKDIYVVDRLVLKAEVSAVQAATLKNFRYSALGYYPILIGKNSYKKNTNYLGFAASVMERTRV